MTSSQQAPDPVRSGSRIAWSLILLAACCGTNGCAAFRTVDGVPARYLPDEFRSVQREPQRTIDLSLLRQTAPRQYRIDGGDVLGIYIDGVLGKTDEPPPVYNPQSDRDVPSVGFPILVREDGTISLPMIKPLFVRGMSFQELEEAIRKAYTDEVPVLRKGAERILVNLQKPRTYRVLVIRQEAASSFGIDDVAGAFNNGSAAGVVGGNIKRGMGRVVRLPAYKNDVLHALAETGGMPGLDAENAVYILRSRRQPAPGARDHALGAADGNITLLGGADAATGVRPASHVGTGGWGHTPVLIAPDPAPFEFDGRWMNETAPFAMSDFTIGSPGVLKIPLAALPGDSPAFVEDDIILQDGDVVLVETRQTEFFFTGGLLGGGQFALPRDYDLDVLGAISIAQNRNVNAGFTNAVGGVSALNRDVTAGASHLMVLRKLDDGNELMIKVDLNKALTNPNERILIRPGDHLFLQYTTFEAIAAFFERHLNEGATIGLTAAALDN